MELNYNISFSVAALFISIILLIIVGLQYSSTDLVNRRYKFFLVGVIAMVALDILTVFTNFYGDKVPVALNMVLNGLYFFSGSSVALLFFYYCLSVGFKNTSPKVRKGFYIANLIIFGLYGLTLILNNFLGFYFRFVDSVYTRGPAYLAVNAVSLFFVIESLIIFIIETKMFNIRQLVATYLFYAFFFLSYTLQLFVFPNILLADFGCALGALMVFFSIETPDYAKLMSTLNELNELKASLEDQVKKRTEELDAEKESYEALTLDTLASLARVIDAKDHYTNGHSFRVAAYACGMGRLLEFSPNQLEQLYFAGLIHDVGKIGISETILNKPAKLTEEEFAIIKKHTSIGGDILKGIKEYRIFEQVARSHHERYDGSGYPDALKEDYIPFTAKIVTICDTFDAMTSDRSYRKALSDEVAINELIKGKGTQFDPRLVDVFLQLYNSFPDSIRNHIKELEIDIKNN